MSRPSVGLWGLANRAGVNGDAALKRYAPWCALVMVPAYGNEMILLGQNAGNSEKKNPPPIPYSPVSPQLRHRNFIWLPAKHVVASVIRRTRDRMRMGLTRSRFNYSAFRDAIFGSNKGEMIGGGEHGERSER